jgi:putative ABC transport system permease protein
LATLRLTGAVGQEVRLDGRPYLVLGVLEPLGSIFGFSRDNVIYIPYSTYQKAYGGRRSLCGVHSSTGSGAARKRRRSSENDHAEPSCARTDDDEGFAMETQDVFLNLYGSATSNIYIVTIEA